MAELADYLGLTGGQAREQFRGLGARRPPLREVLLLPDGAQAPAVKYLDWHKQNVFVS